MREAEALVQRLLAAQNADGGWSYRPASSHGSSHSASWTEATGYAVLGLASQDDPAAVAARARGSAWLLSQQRSSGGWAPTSNVSECTSSTSVAALALLPSDVPNTPTSRSLDSALTWTASQIYPDDLSFSLLLAKALDLPPAHAPGSVAWYPGTAGWVTPTSLAAILLRKSARQRNRPDLSALAQQSCSYLLSRRCVDSGWNHGGSKTRSEDAISYPETTGLALMALRAAGIGLPALSVTLARQFAANPESTEGLAWIQLALDSPDPARLPTPRTTRDCALRLLALSAQRGRNVFLG